MTFITSRYWWILANADMGKAFSRYTRRSSSLGENWLLVAIVVGIASLWAGLYYWDKYRKRIVFRGNNPKSLFLELCKAHQLNRSERSLLLKAAQSRRLNQLALVFIDPAVLSQLTASNDPNAQAYAQLSRKLFGSTVLAEMN